MDMKKLIGLLAIAVAVGMFIMLFVHNILIGLIIIALLIIIGYCCYCGG